MICYNGTLLYLNYFLLCFHFRCREDFKAGKLTLPQERAKQNKTIKFRAILFHPTAVPLICHFPCVLDAREALPPILFLERDRLVKTHLCKDIKFSLKWIWSYSSTQIIMENLKWLRICSSESLYLGRVSSYLTYFYIFKVILPFIRTI